MKTKFSFFDGDSHNFWSERPRSITEYAIGLASLLIPLAMIYLGHLYKESETEEGLHRRYVEIAVNILQQDPSKESLEMRKWAIQILNKYSEVPIEAKAQECMLNQSLPISTSQPKN